ncbi:MAG: hypothetical protein ACJ8OJ_17195, partial [Povalibacter sp.]
DVNAPPNATMILDSDPNRSGPIGFLQFRPDNSALLLQPWTKLDALSNYQVDLAELVFTPNDHQLHQINPVSPVGTRSSVDGIYDLSSDAIIYTNHRNGGPWTMYEGHRDAFATPTVLGSPGTVAGAVYSKDMSVFAVQHSMNTPASPNSYGRLINRSAPGSMITFTDPAYPPIYVDVVGLVED